MHELEVKILEIDKDRIEKRLQDLGAEKISDCILYTVFFDYKDEQLKKQDYLLRMRREGDKTVLTFKKPLKNPEHGVKALEEIEVDVSDFDNMKIILEQALNLHVYRSARKHRITYELGDAEISIDKYCDQYDHVPWFLEIEGPNKESIYACAEKLGHSKKECKDWSFSKLIDHYHKK